MSEGVAETGALNALGGVPADRRGQFSWAMFDWANQPYFTIVTTALFVPYFVNGFIGDEVRGQEILSYTLAFSGGLIAILAPVLGAIADQNGRRKPWIGFLSVLFFVSCFGLWWAEPGAPQGIFSTIFCLVLAAISMETAVVFNHAMLPSVAPARGMGWLSGFAWGLGYFGGIVALLIIQWFLIFPGQMDLPGVPVQLPFGLDASQFEAERLTGPIAAIWYVVFALPMFFFTPDRAATRKGPAAAVRDGLKSLAQTLAQARRYSNIVFFLLGRMIYNDGLGAVFSFGGVYAAAVLGWGSLELGTFGLIMLVFAGFGCLIGGWLDDKIGSKPTIVLSVMTLALGALGLGSVGPDTIFYVIKVTPVSEVPGIFMSAPEKVYMLFSVIMGLGMGPTQSASRTMMARLAPPHMITEFFGLFALSGKATAFLAPLLIGLATTVTQDPRVSMIVILAMLVVGLIILLPVREERVT
ncbi:MAG: MFS transporter [Alphaproteobacteria bacterium]|nr:MAG: MFS transporter [Alphaproteobacteria bacterium]